MKISAIVNYLSTARTEFNALTPSVYQSFVFPIYLKEKLDVSKISHAVSIQGGRGSGKTMFLRHFSHWTQLDKKREDVNPESLRTVILYWKPDTTYCRALSKEWLSEKNARAFFYTYCALDLFHEIISALDNITYHFKGIDNELKNNRDFWEFIDLITNGGCDDLSGIFKWIRHEKFNTVGLINANDTNKLKHLEPKNILEGIINSLRKIEELSETNFKLFIDEFENLAKYQQKIINNYRKHSDLSLSWNVAHKTYADVTVETDGQETLQDPDDYMTIILDEKFADEKNSDYELLAAEIFFLFLQKAGLKTTNELLSPKSLGNPVLQNERNNPEYRKDVLKIIKNIFPRPKIKELAKIACESKAVRNELFNRLKSVPEFNEDLIQELLKNRPDIALTIYAVSNHNSFDPNQLLNHINNNYPTNDSFSEQINFYLFGSLLSLNIKLSSYVDIPVYAGFNRFLMLSKGNIRHFIELCYRAIAHFEFDNDELNIDAIESFPALDYKHMQTGAKATSKRAYDDIKSFPPFGQSLYSIATRLGDIFKLSQMALNQSEPEKGHFFIKLDFGKLDDELHKILEQAKCWRVLIEKGDNTKDKDPYGSALTDYQLNPIYSPKFGITYRRKKNLDLSIEEINIIFFGDGDSYKKLRKEYIKKWKTQDLDGKQDIKPEQKKLL